MKYEAIFLICAVVSGPAIAASLSVSDWNEIVISTQGACLKRQSAAPENAHMTAGQIREFCTCVGERAANSLTAEQAEYIKSTGDGTPLVDATRQAYIFCADSLFQ